MPRSLLRGFQTLTKSVPFVAIFLNTSSACGGDRNFEDFASFLVIFGYRSRKMNFTAAEIGMRIASHIWKNRLAGRKRFPMVTMLEPLETCNLACKGCGRIREYHESVIKQKKMVSVEECLEIVAEAGSPVVSIAGGEPLIHPQIEEIVEGIIAQKRYVFLCTNGLLMEKAMEKIKPSKYFSWVVHLDGMAGTHDYWVGRSGTWTVAMDALKHALKAGYRVCTNTTIFKDSDVIDLRQFFQYLTDLDVEGIMISAGFAYESVATQNIFSDRELSIRFFQEVLSSDRKYKFYNSPLYLEFLRGRRNYPCRAWTNPTYTPLGWRKPCYQIADEHTYSLGELMDDSLWEHYGVGKDPRCASCMMHSGYEAGIVDEMFTNPKEFGALVVAFLRNGGGGR
jgi:hopanoid biosynthesis associated radical SAM protein HpnH